MPRLLLIGPPDAGQPELTRRTESGWIGQRRELLGVTGRWPDGSMSIAGAPEVGLWQAVIGLMDQVGGVPWEHDPHDPQCVGDPWHFPSWLTYDQGTIHATRLPRLGLTILSLVGDGTYGFESALVMSGAHDVVPEPTWYWVEDDNLTLRLPGQDPGWPEGMS